MTAAVRVDSSHADLLAERLRRLPGVSQVAVSDSVPPTGRTAASIYSRFEVEGRAAQAKSGTGGMVTWRTVTPEYFPALRIPILRGRAFQPAEAGAVVISQALAQRLFSQEEAVGRRMRPGPESPWLTVTGIAANVKNNRLDPKDDPNTTCGRGPPRRTLPSGASTPSCARRCRPRRWPPWSGRRSARWMRPCRWRSSPRPTGRHTLCAPALPGRGAGPVRVAGRDAGRHRPLRRHRLLRAATGPRNRRPAVSELTPGGIVGLILSSALRWTCSGALLGLAGAWFGSTLMRSALLFQTEEHHTGVSGGDGTAVGDRFAGRLAARQPGRRAWTHAGAT